MAIRDHSLGPVYLARVRLAHGWIPVHTADVTQMTPPWRRGRVVIVPVLPHNGVAIGLWFKRHNVFSEEPWLNPKWLNTPVDDISLWRNPDDEEADNLTPEYREI